jgi:hypothetical protein
MSTKRVKYITTVSNPDLEVRDPNSFVTSEAEGLLLGFANEGIITVGIIQKPNGKLISCTLDEITVVGG